MDRRCGLKHAMSDEARLGVIPRDGNDRGTVVLDSSRRRQPKPTANGAYLKKSIATAARAIFLGCLYIITNVAGIRRHHRAGSAGMGGGGEDHLRQGRGVRLAR